MCSGTTSSASSTCSRPSGSRASCCSSSGSSPWRCRSGRRIQIAFRSRPVYAKLNSQLDRYQQVFEPLRRLAMFGIPVVLGIFAGVSASSRWEVALAVAEPHPVRQHRPAVRPRRRVLRLRAAVLPRRSSASPRPSCCSRVLARHRHQLPLRRHPRQRPRGASSRSPRASSSPSPPASTCCCRPSASGSTSTRPSPRRGSLITGAGYTDVNADDPRPRHPRRHRRRRRDPVLRHRDHRPLAPAAHRHRAAHRLEPHHRLALPVGHPALPGRAERASPSRRRTSSATSTSTRTPTASPTSKRSRTRRRPTPSRARCATTPRPPPTSASSTRS